MKYGIITPAFNEAEFISDFIHSVIKQTIRPSALVIVDDGSSDDTAYIANKIAKGYDWITVLTRPVETRHEIGSKVVDAFQYGVDHTSHVNWDIIVKLDADQVLPPEYFERVINTFRKDPEIGICGGVCAVPQTFPSMSGQTQNKPNHHLLNNLNEIETVVEKQTDRFHVRGPIKSYRMACFRDIGGLRPIYGWDTLDELLAEYYGWKIWVLQDLKVVHRRATGTKTRAIHLHLITGEMFYRLGYGVLISFLASLKRYQMSPFGISAIISWFGYLRATVSRPDYYVDQSQRQFIRYLRYRRIGNKLKKFLRLNSENE